MKTAFVVTNVLDIRSQPDHRAERVNQLLYADLVTWSDERNGFAEVRRWDGYRGWADLRFLLPLSARRSAEYSRFPQVTTIALQTRLFDADTSSIAPHLLFYGTRLALEGVSGPAAQLVTPTGGRVRVKASAVRPVDRNEPATGTEMVREAKKLLGVPYLWGGVSSPGLDCSGLVQTIGRILGLNLPRDTKEQIGSGRSVDRACIRTGDLLFFPGHVAIAVGRNRIIHSSRGGGGVRIESLAPDNPAYRSDLVNSFKEARRIL